MSTLYLQGNHPLLNFYEYTFTAPHPITGKMVAWRTAEHYFQACKGLYAKRGGMEVVRAIQAAKDAYEAKRLGRAAPLRVALWDRSAFAHMVQAHQYKFSRGDMRTTLVQTRGVQLVEHRKDPLWGDNMDGSGLNLCGKSLMIVRKGLRASD